MAEVLRTEGICKSFGNKKVLENVSLTLGEGEIVCILGISGAGKTTLFNILAGLEKADDGRVYIEGNDVTGETGHISYMLQKDLLIPHKTITDNVSLPLILGGMKKKDARKASEKYFERFGLSGTEDKYPSQLSGGMRQRAALLRTYLFGKKVALLDEPFSALDTITREGIHMWYLSIMRDIRLSTLFITHDIDEAILLSDRIYILGGSPATITSEITVDKSGAGNTEFLLSTDYLELKKRIRSLLG